MALEETHERERKQSAAFTQLPASLQARLEELPAFQDAERSEQAIIDGVGADPQIVLTSVTAHSSTFTREDVDQWLAARISDPQAIELLANRVIRMKSVRMLSVDPMHPLMTTTEILAVEDALAVDAKTLAAKPSAIGAFEVDNSIRAYEQVMLASMPLFWLQIETAFAISQRKTGVVLVAKARGTSTSRTAGSASLPSATD